MNISLYHEKADASYTYSNNYSEAFSTLDHIIFPKISDNIMVKHSSLRENVDNQPDHAPVVLSLNIFIESHFYTPSNHIPRKNWNNANHNQIDTYKSLLDDNLSGIDIPYECLKCRNVLCSDNDHVTSIQLHDHIISACVDAFDNIPTTRKNNKNVPGWNEFVRQNAPM